jgi:predicted metal-dependent hydrolase
VERQPEGVVRSPAETVREAQRLLDAGMPFHAHEVFEDAWKAGSEAAAPLWRGLAQLAVGLTHAARGNAVGGARLLRRGAAGIEGLAGAPYGIDVPALVRWARELADRVERAGPAVDAAREAPRLGGDG